MRRRRPTAHRRGEIAIAINYEAPSPVAPFTSAAFGAAQQYSQDAPLIQAARAQQLQAGIAGAQAYNQGIGDVTQRTIAAGQQNTQLELQKQGYLQNVQLQAAQQAQAAQMQYAQQEQQAAQQRAEQEQQQKMLQQHMDTQFSQAQEMQRQKYEQARSWIQQKLAAGEIDQETATNMDARVNGLQSPLEYKKMKAEAAYRESEARQQDELAKKSAQHQLEVAGRAAQTTQERTIPTYNEDVEARIRSDLGPRPDSPFDLQGKLYDKEYERRLKATPNAVHHWTYTDIEGKTHITKAETTKQQDDAVILERAKRHWQSAYNEQSKEVESSIRRQIKENPGIAPGWDAKARDEAVANRMQTELGAASQEQYIANVLGGKAHPPLIPGSKFGISGVEGGAAATPAPPAVPGAPPDAPKPVAKPFDPEKRETMTDVQRTKVAELDSFAANLGEREDISKDMRIAAVVNLQRVRSLYAEFGSYDAMPPAAKSQFEAAQQFIRALPPDPRKKAAPSTLPPELQKVADNLGLSPLDHLRKK